MTHATRCSALFLILAGALAAPAGAQKLAYPQTRKGDQVDTYFGTKVEDPYRWLEDENSPETKQWVEQENAVTSAYLARVPYRDALKSRLARLQDYARYGAPFRKNDLYFFSKNSGLQNQSVLYVQKGLDGEPQVLLDPNTFSADGTSRMIGFNLSRNGRYAAYGVSTGGSDWTEFHVLDMQTRKPLADVVKWSKFTGTAWQGDGFYYGGYDAPDSAKALTNRNASQRVYYHKVGTPQAADRLVYEDKANPDRLYNISTTEDERFLTLGVTDLKSGKKGNSLWYRDAQGSDSTFRPIVAAIGDDDYFAIESVGKSLLVQTNHGAPNWRVVLVDPAQPAERNWKTVLGERPEPLQSASVAGGKLFATYMKDVTTRAYVHDLRGRLENEIALPGLGSAGGFGGNADDKQVFYTFTSYTFPPSIYRYDIATRKSSLFRAPAIPGFDAARFETKQVFFPSKDGTRIPMFLTYRKGTKLDGHNPAVLYGYGGFNLSQTPGFSAMRLALLEQGVVYAVANIRGGGEYGEKWHDAGTKLRKQTVFVDFIGAAEWLVASKYTAPDRLAIHGGSNGGLLVGAVANQRPDLFKVVVQQAGVMDMLRFHKFTIGSAWIADYGSSEANEAEFKALRAYSPVHNTRPGTAYPATLITTADHDDRVVPAHSYKYAAALQAAQAGDNPILIRIDTRSGHGASSTTKAIEQTADLYSFIFENLKIGPTFVP